MREATIAIEDQRFYQHGAIDLPVADPRRGHRPHVRQDAAGRLDDHDAARPQPLPAVGDASTFERKIKEAVIAERLRAQRTASVDPHRLSQHRPYGTVGRPDRRRACRRRRGCTSTSRPRKRHARQAALLAGLPQAPTDYNPLQLPAGRDRAAQRGAGEDGGARLHQRGARAGGRGGAARLHPNGDYGTASDSYFFDFIRHGARAPLRRRRWSPDGGLQGVHDDQPAPAGARQGGDRRRARPARPTPRRRWSARTRANGYVDAMAQSGSYSQSQFNLATQAHRQPGSTFKAIVLADALAHGIDPFTTDYLSHTLEPGWLAGYPTYTGHDRRRRQPQRAAQPRRRRWSPPTTRSSRSSPPTSARTA